MVRNLKATKADKAVIDAEVKKLLDLKKQAGTSTAAGKPKAEKEQSKAVADKVEAAKGKKTKVEKAKAETEHTPAVDGEGKNIALLG